jgi:hypothetical protein
VPELPAHPDLDQLRRQARELHRAAQKGEPQAVARLRAVSENVSLATAQLALAREYGFTSWPRMKAALDAAAAPPSHGGPARATDAPHGLLCSFCGKSARQVKRLIAGPDAYICDECVGLCDEILENELHHTPRERHRATPGAVDPSAAPGILEGPDGVTARVRLAEEPGEWTSEYAALARMGGLDAAVTVERGRVDLAVKLRGALREPEVADALDRALLLVGDAKDAARRREAVGDRAERLVRRWWEAQTRS